MNPRVPTRWRPNASCRQFLACLILLGLSFSTRAFALTIVPTFDSSITNNPRAADIEATINSTIAVYESIYSDAVTVTITFYQVTNGLGGSSKYYKTVSYSDYHAALLVHATTIDDAVAYSSLPGGPNNPVNNDPNVNLNYPLARALGFTADPPAGDVDGSITLNMPIINITAADTDTNKYSLFAVVAHEIDEVLGFGSALNGVTNGAPPPSGPVWPQDLFRYDANGARSFTSSLNATSYFSFDGSSKLARFNQNQAGDFADWYSSGGQIPQVQDAFQTAGATPVLGVELRGLDAIGFNRQPAPVWVDFGFPPPFNFGTFAAPYPSLARGVNSVAVGGTIVIKSGASSEKPNLTKPMTIVSFGGPVTIGR